MDDGQRLVAHARRLRLLVRHLTGPALRARLELDDLVQEVFLRAWTGGAGLPPQDPADADDRHLWQLLAQIARHTVIDAARVARAAKRGGGKQPIGRADYTRVDGSATAKVDFVADTAGPRTRAIGVETEAELDAAFERLSAEHRRVIGLRQFEGLSAAAAGARMGRSATAVHSLYRRALLAWEAEARSRRGP